MSNRSTDDIVKALMSKADKEPLPKLLHEAAAAGARLGHEAALADIVRRVVSEAKTAPTLNLTLPKKRDKATKGVVQCPSPNCTNPGIRPLHNFCQHHHDTIPAEKRELLRARQIEAKKKALAEAKVAAVKAQREAAAKKPAA